MSRGPEGYEIEMMLVHPDERRRVWSVQTLSSRGRWGSSVGAARHSLLNLLMWHVDDEYDPDFLVPVHFRHCESGEVVVPTEAYEQIVSIPTNVISVSMAGLLRMRLWRSRANPR